MSFASGAVLFAAFASAATLQRHSTFARPRSNVERGNVWEDRRAVALDGAIAGASVWAGIATPLGPVCIGVGRADDGRRATYLSVGGAF